MGEHISIGESLLVTVFSMVIVFIVLIAISYLIDLLRIATNGKSEKEATKSAEGLEKTTKQEIEDNKNNQEELIAVITAVLAVNMEVGVSDINIKSIRKTSPSSPIWAEVGRIDQSLSKL